MLVDAKPIAGRLYRGVLNRVHYALSLRHVRQDYIREIWRGSTPLSDAPRLALVSHFDRSGRFHDFFRHYVRALCEAGLGVIVLSNSPSIDEGSLAELLPLCVMIVHRQNVGYDFGALRDGLSLVDLDKIEFLVTANDSVFGPFRDIGPILKERCDFERADVWGMTDSYDTRYHLQSYFVAYGRTAVRSHAFRDFWQRVRYIDDKMAVIRYYEIGLTQSLLAGGLRVKAVFPYPEITQSFVAEALDSMETELHPMLAAHREWLLREINRGIPLNPTHYFWDHLIATAGFPFLKRELVEKNPMGLPLLVNWRRVVRQADGFPVEQLDDFLKTTLRNRIF